MNDAEWIELRSLWQQKQAALPADIQRYARRQTRGLWVSNLIFWPIVAAEMVFAVWLLAHDPGGPARLDAFVILGAAVVMSAWFFWSQRRAWASPFETPNEMLARFERHLRRARSASWVGAGGFFALTIFVLAQAAVLRGGLPQVWQTSPGVFRNVAAGLAAVLLWPRWVRRRTRRGQARIDAWRQQ